MIQALEILSGITALALIASWIVAPWIFRRFGWHLMKPRRAAVEPARKRRAF